MGNIPQELGQTILYKYRALDTNERIEHVRDIIVNHCLYCASVDSFNDPFEFRAQISLDAPEHIKIEKAIKRIYKECPNVTLEEAKNLALSRLEECERNGPDRIKQSVESYGIVSLAGVLDSILMWSHYADSHKGICIEFRASSDTHLKFFGDALPVTYCEELPIINFYTDDKVAQAKKLISKSADWKYEQEYRIIEFNRNKNKHYEFEPTLISKIYLGLRISEKNVQNIKSFVSEIPKNIRPVLLQADLSPSSYNLKFQQIK